MDGNLVVLTQRSTGALVPAEMTTPAAFWFLNPSNTFTNNVAAGAFGPGFMWDLGTEAAALVGTRSTCNERIPGDMDKPDKPRSAAKRARSVHMALLCLPFKRFDGNMVHSTATGLWLDGGGGRLAPTSSPTQVLSNSSLYKVCGI
jgi:hypothetical protein